MGCMQLPGATSLPNLTTGAGPAPCTSELQQRVPHVMMAFSGHEGLRLRWEVGVHTIMRCAWQHIDASSRGVCSHAQPCSSLVPSPRGTCCLR